MDNIERIIDILAWPFTIIVVVMMLRSPLSSLVPTLKRLKYKDLELEFEKEANKILAEAERDLPDPPKPSKHKNTSVRFSQARLEPADDIMKSWRDLELKLRGISGEGMARCSTGQMIRELTQSGAITVEMSKLILDLSSLRNRVAHTDEEAITYKVSSSFRESVNRVLSALEV